MNQMSLFSKGATGILDCEVGIPAAVILSDKRPTRFGMLPVRKGGSQ
jgi:hypothetical protein